MPDFQETALRSAEAFIREEEDPCFSALTRAFREVFLHYTPDIPDHWIHPEWTGQPDQPETGCCVILALLCSIGRKPDAEDLIQPYFEFMGAMMSVYTPEQSFFAWCAAISAAKIFPEERHYKILADALKQRMRDPESAAARRLHLIASYLSK